MKLKYRKATCSVWRGETQSFTLVNGYEVEGQEYWNEFLDWGDVPPPRMFVYKCRERWVVVESETGAVIPRARSTNGYTMMKNTRKDSVKNAIECLKYEGSEIFVKAINEWKKDKPNNAGGIEHV